MTDAIDGSSLMGGRCQVQCNIKFLFNRSIVVVIVVVVVVIVIDIFVCLLFFMVIIIV